MVIKVLKITRVNIDVLKIGKVEAFDFRKNKMVMKNCVKLRISGVYGEDFEDSDTEIIELFVGDSCGITIKKGSKDGE